MTYKELLNIVTFEEVEPHIKSMSPEAKDSLGWFKLHYDMLPHAANVIICLTTGHDRDKTSMLNPQEEKHLP